jgi:ADP-ribosyl-[dinitrogen reductase] hydrolase
VVKAFQAALFAVADSNTYEATVQRAIAIGGDTDTIAAIAGGLAGAMYGASAIPAEWIKVLHGWPGLVPADLEAMALDAAGVS